MAVDFSKDELNIKLQIIQTFRKHLDFVRNESGPHEGRNDSLYKVGAFNAMRFVFEDMMGGGDFSDTRGEAELASEPGQGNDQPERACAD